MPKPTLTYGCEIEMFQSSRPVADALAAFQTAGLCNHTRLHSYHCRCEECQYDRPNGSLLAAQQDTTVGAEFITRILSTRNNRDTQEMRRLQHVYSDVLEASGWYPDGDDPNGNHIHVGWPENTDHVTRACAASLIQGLWHAERSAWEQNIAAGGCHRVRDYNEFPTVDGYGSGADWYGSWLGTRTATVEFRLWNTPLEPDRLLVHPALSVALLHWALDVIDEEGDIVAFRNARSASEWAANRARPSRKRIAKIVQDIWPDRRSAVKAAELVAN